MRFAVAFSADIDLEKRIRADHPLRVIRVITNAALKSVSGEFQKLYSPLGRESIAPERLLRALLLQAFYSIRSERQLVERSRQRADDAARALLAAFAARHWGVRPAECRAQGGQIAHLPSRRAVSYLIWSEFG